MMAGGKPSDLLIEDGGFFHDFYFLSHFLTVRTSITWHTSGISMPSETIVGIKTEINHPSTDDTTVTIRVWMAQKRVDFG